MLDRGDGIQRPHEQLYLSELTTQAAALGVDDRFGFSASGTTCRACSRRPTFIASRTPLPNRSVSPSSKPFTRACPSSPPASAAQIEIVTDDCGRLLPPGDAAVLADTLSTLIDDPASRRALGAAGPARRRAVPHRRSSCRDWKRSCARPSRRRWSENPLWFITSSPANIHRTRRGRRLLPVARFGTGAGGSGSRVDRPGRTRHGGRVGRHGPPYRRPLVGRRPRPHRRGEIDEFSAHASCSCNMCRMPGVTRV